MGSCSEIRPGTNLIGCEEEEKNVFWRQLDQVIMEIPENERVIIGADLNGHVGRRRCGEERADGRWSVGERNREEERIMEHAVAYDLTIVNTCFRKGEEHLITYKSGDRVSQIDYILCRRKYLQEMRNCKVINGESVTQQHRLVVADCYKADTKVKRKNQRQLRIKWWKLKEEALRNKFKEKVLEKLREAGEEILGKTSGKGPPEEKEMWWWNEEVQKEIKEKKEAKKRWDLTGSQEDMETYKMRKKNAKGAAARAKNKGDRES
ncbi:hypothetical protein J437_LFUL004451 [Ladona fulva]|uniref:Endonuclease/exonuclease/phosphatase domain-containing protein n=1 Tax=Ladona fulva TaxID=123851 RepID=A0A8K0K149_LADFU|nr:hypothetical protein J437_LFUL004451 [Ladona fulva]